MSLPNHVYDRLPSTDHFRLLKLQPRDGSQRLNISLHTFHHLKCPKYTAISYTWGENRLQNRLTITTKSWFSSTQSQLSIGNQAHDVLKVLQTSSARWMWLDAICIDQKCIPERNHQVKLMAQIFDNADNVIAWLGQERDDSSVIHSSIERAFKYMDAGLRHALVLCETLRREQPVEDALLLNLFPINAGVPSVPWRELRDINEDEIEKPWNTTEERQHFDVFCTRIYWNRKWIIQELVYPKQVTLQYGSLTLPMIIAEDFFHYWSQDVSLPVSRLMMHRFYHRKRCENPNSMYAHFPGTLIVLMTTYFDNQCREPIDHIYALVNLVADVHRRQVPINYGASLAQQLTDILRYLQEVEQLEAHYFFRWAAQLCMLVKLDPLQLRHMPRIEHTFHFQFSHYGGVHLQPESPWSKVCRKLALPIRSSTHLHCVNSAETCDPDERAAYLEGASNSAAFTLPEDMEFFKVDKHSGSDVYGLADCLEDDDHILVPGSSRLGLVVREVDGRVHFVGSAWLFSGDREQVNTLSPEYHYGAVSWGTDNPLLHISMEALTLLELAAVLGELDAIKVM